MGKAQKKRSVRRHNPVRVPDSHLPKGLEAAAATSAKKNDVLPIIQKIESTDAHERTWACSAVSNLIQNDPSTRRLLQGKNIVGVLINRLSDSVEEVVVEAAGALRNLCIDGGYYICAEMYNKNILAPLKSFVPKISTALDQLLSAPASAPENTHDLVYGLAENVITLIWCLSETSNKALNAINEARLVPFLMAFLEHRNKLPSRTVAAAAQCLYVLSDDNPPVTSDIRANSSYTSCLLAVAQDESQVPPESLSKGKEKDVQEVVEERRVSIRLLAVGILKNISPIPAPSLASTVDIDRNVVLPLVAPLLANTSLSEASDRVVELVSQEDDIPEQKPATSLKNALKTDHKSPKERALERIEARLRNVQLALEILTGVCATLPDPEPAAAGDDDAADDDTGNGNGDDDDDDMDADDDEDAVEEDSFPAPPSPEKDTSNSTAAAPTAATTSAFLPSILPALLALIQPTSCSFPPLASASASLAPPPPHPPTTSALGAIHVCALECLNNIFLALALSGNAGAGAGAELQADMDACTRVWGGVWEALGKVGLEGGPGQERRKEMWEVAVGVMWGIGGLWRGQLQPNEEQVAVLIQLCDASTDDQVKVKCIGALECLAQHPTSIDANRVIASYLLTLASTRPSAALTAEPILQAASALIDIFADEGAPYDVNFRRDGYLPALAGALDSVRRAVRSVDRKKEGGRALRARGEEILENLRAFVKYRRELKL